MQIRQVRIFQQIQYDYCALELREKAKSGQPCYEPQEHPAKETR